MKTINKTILLLLIITAASSVQGQNTGVLGRKFSIHAGLNAGAYMDSYFKGSIEDEYYGTWIKHRLSPTFAIDFACARKASINLNYFGFGREFEVMDRIHNYAVRPFSFKAKVYTLSFKKYVGDRNSYIAPIGFYWGFMASIVKVTVNDDGKSTSPSGGQISENMHLMPGFHLGKHNVYFDRVIFDAAIQLSILPALPSERRGAESMSLREDADIAAELIFRRTLLLNGRFTLGVLLF